MQASDSTGNGISALEPIQNETITAARQRVYETKQLLRQTLPRTPETYAAGWTPSNYPMATQALTYWVLFGEDDSFAQIWWRYLLGGNNRDGMKEIFRDLDGNAVFDSNQQKHIANHWMVSGVIDLETIERVYYELDLRPITIDPRAWIAPKTVATPFERVLRRTSPLELCNTLSPAELEWLLFRAYGVGRVRKRRRAMAMPIRRAMSSKARFLEAHFMELARTDPERATSLAQCLS